MSFDDHDCQSYTVSMTDLFNGLDPVKKKICEILKTFSDDAESAYKAAACILLIPDFPAKQSIVAQCMVNVIDAINEYSETLLKEQLVPAISSVEFVRYSNKKEKDIRSVIDSCWNRGLKQLYDEQKKIQELFMERNPAFERAIKDDDIPQEQKVRMKKEFGIKISKMQKADKALNSCRHLNINFHTIAEEEFRTHIANIENYILELDSPLYLEKKEVLDGILESANTKSD